MEEIKKYCPCCKSSNVTFKRETIKAGRASYKVCGVRIGNTGIKHTTIGICKNCGYTGYPNSFVTESQLRNMEGRRKVAEIRRAEKRKKREERKNGSNKKSKLNTILIVILVIFILANI